MNAAFNYVGRIYESLVDAHLDLGQIGQELFRRGIPRTPAQIVHDLDSVYQFAGYSASHPAPAAPTQKQIDAEIERSRDRFGDSSCKHIR